MGVGHKFPEEMTSCEGQMRALLLHFRSLRTDEGLPAVCLPALYAEMMEDLAHCSSASAFPTLTTFLAFADDEKVSFTDHFIRPYLWHCYQRLVTSAWPPPPSWLQTPPSLDYAKSGWHVYAPVTGDRITDA